MEVQTTLALADSSSDDSSSSTSSDDDEIIALAWLEQQRRGLRSIQRLRREHQRKTRRTQTILSMMLASMNSGRGKNRSVWIHPVIKDKKDNLWDRTKLLDDAEFVKKYRLGRASFDFILEKISPVLKKNDTNLRKALPADFRMAVAVYVLKSGCYSSVAANVFKVGESTVPVLLHEFCKAVNQVLLTETIKFPKTKAEKEAAAKDFCENWQFPNTIGALDGTHFPIVSPKLNPQNYLNYKKYNSLVLLALVDANCQFSYVNAGKPGGVSDAEIFHASQLESILTDEDKMGDMHVVADEAFPLLKGLMKPFPVTEQMSEREEHFNARLSRAKSVAEEAFNRLKSRWKILMKRSDYNVENLKEIIKTCSILHNVCQKFDDKFYDSWLTKLVAFDARFPQPDRILKGTENVFAVEKRSNLTEELFNDNVIFEYEK
ncbi:uncharacterized protein LOC132195124 [Neocloeon triangulifer]|uniref:uncharacterized protein LOC132195124 n=1 Tax=Neocloeon triangulifer TaxID=2078957 RepID=UPI00286F3C5F|nr:uncharacterized protein LOC132195124 [Neocloeon triangulifer]